MEHRISWDELPDRLRESIEARTGPIIAAHTAAAGENSPLAATVETSQGKTFVKGLPSGHRRVITQAREAAVAPLVKGRSPELRWAFDEDGWNVLGFQHLEGRHADYAPGSPDLLSVVDLMSAVNDEVSFAAQDKLFKRAEDRWKSYVDGPDTAKLFAGDTLTHTDWAPHNVLITSDGPWLIDWAWPTLGAAWTDPAHWIIRLIAAGHSAVAAEELASRMPSFARADPSHIDAFVTANVRLWNEIEANDAGSRAWVVSMAAAAHTWAAHRAQMRRL